MPTGKDGQSIAVVEERRNLRGVQHSSTRTTVTSPQSLAMLRRRIAVAVPNMNLLNDNSMYNKAKEMAQKARQEKHGSHSSILARWKNDYEYRNSLSLVGWTEHHKLLFDRTALENHSYVATQAERIGNSKHWRLTLNQEGAQQPLHQRPDFAQAKRE